MLGVVGPSWTKAAWNGCCRKVGNQARLSEKAGWLSLFGCKSVNIFCRMPIRLELHSCCLTCYITAITLQCFKIFCLWFPQHYHFYYVHSCASNVPITLANLCQAHKNLFPVFSVRMPKAIGSENVWDGHTFIVILWSNKTMSGLRGLCPVCMNLSWNCSIYSRLMEQSVRVCSAEHT